MRNSMTWIRSVASWCGSTGDRSAISESSALSGSVTSRQIAATFIECIFNVCYLGPPTITPMPHVSSNNHGGILGNRNKLATHLPSGVPIDLFSTTESNWHNSVVCRTGSAAHNITIATRAKQLGWTWNPYGSGFTRDAGTETYTVANEADLFRFLNMEFATPQDR